MGEIAKFSIVISNYNYGHFLRQAIDSALNIEWDNCEVIVVDDGSTDNSRSIISSYGSQILSILQENQGQRIATNNGFSLSSGDLVIFLDSDDVLLPELGKEVASVWHSGISKVQVLMEKIDQTGRPLQSRLPRISAQVNSRNIRKWALEIGEYPTPPGSGNIYSRQFLEKIMPLNSERDNAPDTTCIAMAPFFGDVVSIDKTLALYRIHDSNDSNMVARDENFGREVGRAIKRLKASQDACRTNGVSPPPFAVLRRGSHLLQLRAASLRLLPSQHPLPGDSRLTICWDALSLPFRSSFEPLHRRFIMAVYVLILLVCPLALARGLIRKRFQPR